MSALTASTMVRSGPRRQGPDPMTRMLMFTVVLGDDDDHVEELTHNAAIRWDTAALVTSGKTWRRHGSHPLGDDWAYVRDLIPMEWSREDALKVVDQVPTSSGDLGQVAADGRRLTECHQELRRLNGQA